MTKQEFNEKDEKDEKEAQKHEEKSQEEKWRRDPLGALVWAVALIWAGVVFLAENLGVLDGFTAFFNNLFGREPSEIVNLPFLPLEAWSLFFLGLGILLLLEVLIRLTVPAYRRPVLGTTIIAIVFLGLGIGSWGVVWPLVLIVVGIALLAGSLFRGKS